MKTRKLNVLVACESSGTVRDAFRKLNHNAWSCDLLPCDADPRYHIQDDVLALLRGDGVKAVPNTRQPLRSFDPSKWDLMIAHPPCTYLCNSGVRWLYNWSSVRASFIPDITRWANMTKGISFFNALWHANIPHIAMENPIMHHHARNLIRDQQKQSQIIQPWEHGHPESKATCLWLNNLPLLEASNILQKPASGRWDNQTPSGQNKLGPSANRGKLRSKTYSGIATAFAKQWSKYILNAS